MAQQSPNVTMLPVVRCSCNDLVGSDAEVGDLVNVPVWNRMAHIRFGFAEDACARRTIMMFVIRNCLLFRISWLCFLDAL